MSNIKQNYVDNILLGENSYNGVLYRINEVIKKAQADTIQGSEFLSEMYKTLNESVTPMLSLKPFITKGEELAPDDLTVGEVMKKLKKYIGGNVDLNFIINLCKEEHYANMLRAGIPPEETVKTVQEFFNKKSSETEKLIKEGIFDCLKSDLLGDIKKQLGCNENENTDDNDPEKDDKEVKTAKLNENMFMPINGIAMYAPVGFIHKDRTGQNYAYTEGTFVRLNESGIDNEAVEVPVVKDLDNKHFKLMRAIDECIYNPETNEFRLKEKWDMDIKLNGDGEVIITLVNGNTKKVNKEDLHWLFIETLQEYERNPMLTDGKFSEDIKKRYMRDADNFCSLAMNIDNIVKFDTMTAVKGINESALFENSMKFPKLLVLNQSHNVEYENFKTLCESTQELRGVLSDVFYTQLNEEEKFNNQHISKLSRLNEQQSNINKELTQIERMKSVAEPNSPAMHRLMEMEDKYNKLLDKNIHEIKELQEEKLY